MTKRVHRPVVTEPVMVDGVSVDTGYPNERHVTVRGHFGVVTFVVPARRWQSLICNDQWMTTEYELVLRRRGTPERLWDWRKRGPGVTVLMGKAAGLRVYAYDPIAGYYRDTDRGRCAFAALAYVFGLIADALDWRAHSTFAALERNA